MTFLKIQIIILNSQYYYLYFINSLFILNLFLLFEEIYFLLFIIITILLFVTFINQFILPECSICYLYFDFGFKIPIKVLLTNQLLSF